MKHYVLLLLCALGIINAKAQLVNYAIQFPNARLLQNAIREGDTLKIASDISASSDCPHAANDVWPMGDTLLLRAALWNGVASTYFSLNPYLSTVLNPWGLPFQIDVPTSNIDLGIGGEKRIYFYCANSDRIFYCSDTPILDFKYYNGPCEANFEVVKDTTTSGVYYCYNNSYGNNLKYVWEFGDGDSSTLQLPTHTYQHSGSRDISLTVHNLSGCTYKLTKWTYINFKNDEGPIQLIVRQGTPTFTGVPNVEEALTPVVFPNPATNTLNVGLDNKPADEIAIYDLNGKQLLQAIHPNGNQIDISNLANGMYVVQVKAAGKKAQAKWIKQ